MWRHPSVLEEDLGPCLQSHPPLKYAIRSSGSLDNYRQLNVSSSRMVRLADLQSERNDCWLWRRLNGLSAVVKLRFTWTCVMGVVGLVVVIQNVHRDLRTSSLLIYIYGVSWKTRPTGSKHRLVHWILTRTPRNYSTGNKPLFGTSSAVYLKQWVTLWTL